ncbi:hypothetical protein D9M69_373140 [compost metagenome]
MDQQHEREHEDQMIETQEYVLDAEQEIGPGHFKTGLGAGRTEGGRLGHEAPNLGAAILVFDAHQCFGQRGLEPVDDDRAIPQSPRAVDGPPLQIGAAFEPRHRRGPFDALFWQMRVECQPHPALRRHLPENGEGVVCRFAYVEIGRPNLMSDSGSAEQQEDRQGEKRAKRSHQLSPAAVAASTLTW